MSRLGPGGGTSPVEDEAETATGEQIRADRRLRVVEEGSEEQPAMPSFEQIYRQYARYVATIALRLLGRPDDVDDIVHETFLQARRSLPRLREPRALKGWLGTITVRVTRKWLRRAQVRRVFGLDSIAADEVAQGQLSPDDYEYVHSAYASLSQLGTDQRIAWVLRRVHGAQLDMVASMTGCSLATAKRRIAAADKTLGKVSK